MQYFIKILNDDTQDLLNEKYLLGDQSFKVFWAGTGFESLQRIISEAPDILDTICILDETGKDYTVEEFLDTIKKLKIRIQD
tara:strand:+ start:117 stop:362 length:246 start_codon:yes stop_codon:yes gene_type:complete